MKVTGAGGVGQGQGPRPTRPAGGEGFRLPAASAAAGPSQVSGVGATQATMGVQSLIALQEVGGPLERRRRAVGRAGRILDVLDEVKVALLDGDLNAGDLDRLRRVVREERQATEDPKLEALLNEIETRAAVEMAKLETSGRTS